ncbi:MAG: hypothetical protein IT243_07630 [Bacteroidia bacterium]|nr:hypothetical protein [Bacteroidia bacterium]
MKEIDKSMESIEEKFFAYNQMTFETFEKFRLRFSIKKSQIQKELEHCDTSISNLEKVMNSVALLSSNLALVWE